MFRRLLSTSLAAFSAAPSAAKMATPLAKPCKFALIQLATGSDKSANLLHAKEKVTEAAQRGADVVVLPECFNSPYGTEHFPQYAEPIPALTSASVDADASPSYHALSALAASLQIHLIAGSIPERDPATDKLYNTSMVFSPTGALLATHRKIHLFDIDIPGKIRFIESDSLSPGETPTLITLPGFGKVGVAICYDVRFPELAMIAARQGAFAMVYPGAFNMTTGPLHWELLGRARAVDNQIYVAMCSPARDMDAGYHAWGGSMVVDPNAEVCVKAESSEETVEWVMEPEKINATRAGIPVTKQRRFDVYADVSKVGPTEPKV